MWLNNLSRHAFNGRVFQETVMLTGHPDHVI